MENKLSAKHKEDVMAAGTTLHRQLKASESNNNAVPGHQSNDTETRKSKEIQKDKPHVYQPNIPPSTKSRVKGKDRGRSL